MQIGILCLLLFIQMGCSYCFVKESKLDHSAACYLCYILPLVSLTYYFTLQIYPAFSQYWFMPLLFGYIYLLIPVFIPAYFADKSASYPSFMKGMALIFSSVGSVLFFFLKAIPLHNNPISREEEIRHMLHASSNENDIDEPQKEFIENIFELDDTAVKEICTHRSEVVSLYRDDSIEKWKQVIQDNRHTFYPVMGEDDDDVIGILDTRDFFRLKDVSFENIFKSCLDKPLFIYENTKADDLIYAMKEERVYFAVVLDEYGGMEGIVTLHDVIETLLGDMQEQDEEIAPKEIQAIGENRWKIYGSADIGEVSKELNIDLDDEDFDTFGGYILGKLGKIPEDGIYKISLTIGSIHIIIREIKNHRVGLCIVEKEEKEEKLQS